MSRMMDAMTQSTQLQRTLLGSDETLSHVADVPWLTLPPGYAFKVTFPFAGATARFRVCRTARPERDISVYLDTAGVLGGVTQSYWEAYPIADDTARFPMADGEALIAAIVAELENGR